MLVLLFYKIRVSVVIKIFIVFFLLPAIAFDSKNKDNNDLASVELENEFLRKKLANEFDHNHLKFNNLADEGKQADDQNVKMTPQEPVLIDVSQPGIATRNTRRISVSIDE